MKKLEKNSKDADVAQAFERYLFDFVERQSNDNEVYRQIKHHFGYTEGANLRRGKRLRPRLVIAAAQSFGVNPESAFPACAAVELLHNYSLIHDDIEDGDALRHGRQTLWSAFGLAHGVNAGDNLGALAHLALIPLSTMLDEKAAFAMSTELAAANVRMCEGQALDLSLEDTYDVTIETYLQMISGKTAALFACACALGARCAAATESEVRRCSRVGHSYGLAFQIRDDIMGSWGESERTGKANAGDIARRKKTYPVVWAMERAAPPVGRLIRDAYARGRTPFDTATTQRLLDALEVAGAYSAAVEAADKYFEEALQQAQAMTPLHDFVEATRA